MLPDPQPHYDFATWLTTERARLERTLFVAGEVFAMSGASATHNLIAANIIAALHGQMRGRPCQVYASDLKVRIETADVCCYPDVLAICGQPQFYDHRQDVVLNPLLVIEVLSKSTEVYDRVAKFTAYRQLPSLQAYLLVAQDRSNAELYTRAGSGQWTVSFYAQPNDLITLTVVNCILKLAEVYAKVVFAPHNPLDCFQRTLADDNIGKGRL